MTLILLNNNRMKPTCIVGLGRKMLAEEKHHHNTLVLFCKDLLT